MKDKVNAHTAVCRATPLRTSCAARIAWHAHARYARAHTHAARMRTHARLHARACAHLRTCARTTRLHTRCAFHSAHAPLPSRTHHLRLYTCFMGLRWKWKEDSAHKHHYYFTYVVFDAHALPPAPYALCSARRAHARNALHAPTNDARRAAPPPAHPSYYAAVANVCATNLRYTLAGRLAASHLIAGAIPPGFRSVAPWRHRASAFSLMVWFMPLHRIPVCCFLSVHAAYAFSCPFFFAHYVFARTAPSVHSYSPTHTPRTRTFSFVFIRFTVERRRNAVPARDFVPVDDVAVGGIPFALPRRTFRACRAPLLRCKAHFPNHYAAYCAATPSIFRTWAMFGTLTTTHLCAF